MLDVPAEVAALTEGQLDFGPWKRISYRELDGLRREAALVKIIGENPRPVASNGTGLYPGVAGGVDCLRRNHHEAMPVPEFSTGQYVVG